MWNWLEYLRFTPFQRQSSKPARSDWELAYKILFRAFYASYDTDLVTNQAEILRRRYLDQGIWPQSALGGRIRLIGHGTHMVSYLMQPADTFENAQPVVFKIPEPDWLQASHDKGRRSWLKAMAKVQADARNIPLVPPMHLSFLSETPVLSLPYGDGASTFASPHWGKLSVLKDQLAGKLCELNLEIDDVLQIRVAGGIPFVCDWSDLQCKVWA